MRRRGVVAAVVLGLLGLGWSVPAVDAAPTEGTPTATATPANDLVHRQRVRLSTAGWQPGTYVMVFQCPRGGVTSDRCEELRGGHLDGIRTGPEGRAGIVAHVQVVLDGAHGRVDCRVRDCVLVVTRYLDSPSRRAVVPLSFDPDGPDPARPELTVTPDTDLVDGQEVVVEAPDVSARPADTVGVVPCRLPVRSMDDCDTVREVRVGGSGHLDGPVRVSAVIHVHDGPHDCRLEPCALMVLDYPRVFRIPVSEMPLAPTAFDPEGPLAPAPVIAVDPAEDLVDDQRVDVTGTGFAPDEPLEVRQCAGPIPTNGRMPTRCDWVYDFPIRADDSGALTVEATVRTTIVGVFDTSDCRVQTCRLVVGHGGPGRLVSVPLDFDPDVPPLNGRITVTPSTGLTPGDVVTIRGSGWRSGDTILLNLCTPRAGDIWSCSNSGQLQVDLGPPDGGGPGVGFVEDYRVGRWTVGPEPDYQDWDCLVRRCVILAHSASDSSDVGRVELRFR